MTRRTRRKTRRKGAAAAKRPASKAATTKAPSTKAPTTKAPTTKAPTTKAGRALRGKISRATRAYKLADASVQTVARRGGIIGREIAQPGAILHPEVLRMVQEKLLAGGEAAGAMLMRMAGGQALWSDFWMLQVRRAFVVLPQMAASPSPVHLAGLAARSGGVLMSDCLAFWARAAEVTEIVADTGARPVLRVAAANARRLAGA